VRRRKAEALEGRKREGKGMMRMEVIVERKKVDE
jgi:hypothetical protein